MNGRQLAKLIHRDIRGFVFDRKLEYEWIVDIRDAVIAVYDDFPHIVGKMEVDALIEMAYKKVMDEKQAEPAPAPDEDLDYLFKPVEPRVAARKTDEQEGWGAW